MQIVHRLGLKSSAEGAGRDRGDAETAVKELRRRRCRRQWCNGRRHVQSVPAQWRVRAVGTKTHYSQGRAWMGAR